jgi:hypothetical protein
MRPLGVEKLEIRRNAAADLGQAMSGLEAEGEANGSALFCRARSPHIHELVGENDPAAARLDVDQDGYISPQDAQLILDQIEFQKISLDLADVQFPSEVTNVENKSYQFDVDRDGLVSATDALSVINRVHFYNSLVPCTCTSCLASAVVDGA